MLLAIFPAVTPLLPISAIAPRARPVWSAEPQPRRRCSPGPRGALDGRDHTGGGASARPAGELATRDRRAGPGGAGLRRPSAPPARPPGRGLLKGRPRAGPAGAQEAARARGLGPRERGSRARADGTVVAPRRRGPALLPAATSRSPGGRRGKSREVSRSADSAWPQVRAPEPGRPVRFPRLRRPHASRSRLLAAGSPVPTRVLWAPPGLTHISVLGA